MGKKCYTNRELSWLQFNERVLNEAGNPAVPLAERLSFAAIYQSNLDEFFMVRVGTLMAQISAGDDERDNKTNMTAKEQVAAIVKRTAELEEKKGRVYEQLMGELEPDEGSVKWGVSTIRSYLPKDNCRNGDILSMFLVRIHCLFI